MTPITVAALVISEMTLKQHRCTCDKLQEALLSAASLHHTLTSLACYLIVPQGTRVEKVINEVFEGHTHNFIECVDVEYKSTRRESFMDLQLDVKGCANIYDSFDKYTAVEMMTGENQYKAEGYGLQVRLGGSLEQHCIEQYTASCSKQHAPSCASILDSK